MAMRKISQLLLHDSAIQLDGVTGVDWHEFGHVEQFGINAETHEWMRKINPYVEKLPVELGFDRKYYVVFNRFESFQAWADVVAPSMLELRIEQKEDDGNLWVRNITYCGSFTVFWAE